MVKGATQIASRKTIPRPRLRSRRTPHPAERNQIQGARHALGFFATPCPSSHRADAPSSSEKWLRMSKPASLASVNGPISLPTAPASGHTPQARSASSSASAANPAAYARRRNSRSATAAGTKSSSASRWKAFLRRIRGAAREAAAEWRACAVIARAREAVPEEGQR